MIDQVKVFAPATIANLGPGYDVLGIALEKPGDIVTATKNSGKNIIISDISGIATELPKDINRNTAGLAAKEVLRKADAKFGVELRIQKGLKIGTGLGSSAASAAAAAVAVNHLLPRPLSMRDVILAAADGEKAASNHPHTD
ncbi:MAG: GHMP family kinase ATP-binding protein, partial [Candidatus Ranarchaeia archaeon]